jgi:hypothetical protein
MESAGHVKNYYYGETVQYIQDVPGGKVSIQGGHSIGHSKQKHVLFRTVSEIELLHCTLYRRATRHVHTRVAKCIGVAGGIFGNVLYRVNCTNFVT